MIDFNLKEKTVGFYLALSAAVLSIIAGIVYLAAYSGSVYLNTAGATLAIIAGILFMVLSIFKPTQPFAALVECVLIFISFVMFINSSYLYFSEILFGANNIAKIFAGLGAMNPNYAVCLLFFLIATVLSNIGIYMKPVKSVKDDIRETVKEGNN